MHLDKISLSPKNGRKDSLESGRKRDPKRGDWRNKHEHEGGCLGSYVLLQNKSVWCCDQPLSTDGGHWAEIRGKNQGDGARSRKKKKPELPLF